MKETSSWENLTHFSKNIDMNFINRLYNSLSYRSFDVLIPYYRLKQNYRIRDIRKKERIRVLFVIAELGSWKTEILYLAMLNHPRFEPLLGVTTSQEVSGSKAKLIDYLIKKGYFYIDIDSIAHNIQNINPDIIFYYKPYVSSYPSGLFIEKNRKPVVCQINYAFNQGGTAEPYLHQIRKYAWREFVENRLVLETMTSLKGVYTGNKVVTGTPMQDILLLPKDNFEDPWKDKTGRKRIIYAPHHSLKGTNGGFIEYSTFLENGDFILELAKKYSDRVTWAFKPHPTLYPKLVNLWGKEKTDAYYNAWVNLGIGQLELGEYVGLFKHSDAMIHDSCSFIAEYMYTHKPVMFLEKKHRTADEMLLGEFGYSSYKLHYHGQNFKQIKDFVDDVINYRDPNMEQRTTFFDEYLLPPNGKTACENIINEILGLKI